MDHSCQTNARSRDNATVYLLGTLLLEVLTSRRRFAGDASSSTGAVSDPRALVVRSEMPALRRLALRMVDRDEQQRPTESEIIRELRAILDPADKNDRASWFFFEPVVDEGPAAWSRMPGAGTGDGALDDVAFDDVAFDNTTFDNTVPCYGDGDESGDGARRVSRWVMALTGAACAMAMALGWQAVSAQQQEDRHRARAIVSAADAADSQDLIARLRRTGQEQAQLVLAQQRELDELGAEVGRTKDKRTRVTKTLKRERRKRTRLDSELASQRARIERAQTDLVTSAQELDVEREHSEQVSERLSATNDELTQERAAHTQAKAALAQAREQLDTEKRAHSQTQRALADNQQALDQETRALATEQDSHQRTKQRLAPTPSE